MWFYITDWDYENTETETVETFEDTTSPHSGLPGKTHQSNPFLHKHASIVSGSPWALVIFKTHANILFDFLSANHSLPAQVDYQAQQG